MASSSEGYHEPIESLTESTRDLHRALVSLQEELEAIDWYRQRADACDDAGLRAVLLHNLEEEVEHAMMALEWIRRREPRFDAMARRYLFSDGDLTSIEQQDQERGDPAPRHDLGLGDLRQEHR
jgi:ferritin-like protein